MPQQVKVPQTRAEFESLQLRREELRAQIEALTDRRGEIAQQRLETKARIGSGAPDGPLFAELTRTMDELGRRIVQLDREWVEVNDALLTATRRGIAGEDVHVIAEPPPPPAIPTIHVGGSRFDAGVADPRFLTLLAGEAVLFVLLGVIGWRYLKRKYERRVIDPPPMQDVAQLRHAVDAIALEVERISEGQRYVTKLLSEKGAAAGDRLQS